MLTQLRAHYAVVGGGIIKVGGGGGQEKIAICLLNSTNSRPKFVNLKDSCSI